MLINISNHPLASWSSKQIETVQKQYGQVVDIPFPQINPELTEAQIENIGEDYFTKIVSFLSNTKDKINAVHVMGELNFTFSIVTKLLHSGITCIASTTERNSTENNGKKITEFNFVKFREYKLPRIHE